MGFEEVEDWTLDSGFSPQSPTSRSLRPQSELWGWPLLAYWGIWLQAFTEVGTGTRRCRCHTFLLHHRGPNFRFNLLTFQSDVDSSGCCTSAGQLRRDTNNATTAYGWQRF
jgi:hypothetical protein